MSTDVKIKAPGAISESSFVNLGSGKSKLQSTWTLSTDNWTGGLAASTTDIPFVSSIKFYTWFPAADRLSIEPYLSMNNWYTSNKNAIDRANLTETAHVGSWALVLEISTNTKSTDFVMPPQQKVARTSTTYGGYGAGNLCSVATTTSSSFQTSYAFSPPVDWWGDSFAIAISNGTTGAKAPAFRCGSRITTAGTAGTVGATGAYTCGSESGWSIDTDNIKNYTTIASTEKTTLIGSAASATAAETGKRWVNNQDSTSAGRAGTKVVCDTTKWMLDSACDGITRWGYGALTEYTSATAPGKRTAWLFLSDASTRDANSFGINAFDVINVMVYQYKEF